MRWILTGLCWLLISGCFSDVTQGRLDAGPSGAATDTISSPDSDDDTSTGGERDTQPPPQPQCDGTPHRCVDFCGSDAVSPAECTAEGWQCPDGVLMESCPQDTCWGHPSPCEADCTGMPIAATCVDGEWVCGGFDCACEGEAPPCVLSCDLQDQGWEAVCQEGEWVCQGGIFLQECLPPDCEAWPRSCECDDPSGEQCEEDAVLQCACPYDDFWECECFKVSCDGEPPTCLPQCGYVAEDEILQGTCDAGVWVCPEATVAAASCDEWCTGEPDSCGCMCGQTNRCEDGEAYCECEPPPMCVDACNMTWEEQEAECVAPDTWACPPGLFLESECEACEFPTYPDNCKEVSLFQCGLWADCDNGTVYAEWHEHVMCNGVEDLVFFDCTYECPKGCREDVDPWDWPYPENGKQLVKMFCK